MGLNPSKGERGTAGRRQMAPEPFPVEMSLAASRSAGPADTGMEPAPEQRPEGECRRTPSSQDETPRALRVLIFSDSAAILDETARPLMRSGARVMTAVTGSQMRRILRNACIDVVVCDPKRSDEARAAAQMRNGVCRCGAGRPVIVLAGTCTQVDSARNGITHAAPEDAPTRTAKLVRLAALSRAVSLLRTCTT